MDWQAAHPHALAANGDAAGSLLVFTGMVRLRITVPAPAQAQLRASCASVSYAFGHWDGMARAPRRERFGAP